MNTTLFISNRSTMITIESWFIPLDILAILCLGSTIMFGIIILIVISINKRCHTVSMLPIANICLTGLLSAIIQFVINAYILHNDLNQIDYPDKYCILRSYLSYIGGCLYNYSYALSAFQRYMYAVHPTRLYWQTVRVQILLIALSWLFAFIYPLYFVLSGSITYNVHNQICQVEFQSSVAIFYLLILIFIIPVNLVICIYIRLVYYIHTINQRVRPACTSRREQRDLKMVRQVVILVLILFIAGFPLAVFIFLSFAKLEPIYHYRIGMVSINASKLFVLIALAKFIDPLREAIKKFLNCRTNIITPTVN